MSLSYFRESLDKQKGGAPVYAGGITFYVKRWGTPESQAFLRELNRKLFGPFHKSQEGDQATIYAEWLCWAVTGWDDMLGEDGEPVTYSPDSARDIFTNEEYFLSLNMVLINGAMNFEHYLHEEATADAEDLKKK